MSTPWEIDPTVPDRDGAGAEGGAVGGDSAEETQEDRERPNPFQPTGASTSYPPDDGGEAIELSNMPNEEVTAFLGPDYIPTVIDYVDEEERENWVKKVKRFIKDLFPNVNFEKLGPIGLGKKIENRFRLVKFGARGGESRTMKADNSGLLKSFIDSNREALGKSAEELEAEKQQVERALRQRLAEEEQQLEEREKQTTLEQKTAENVQNLKRRLEQTRARRKGLKEEQPLSNKTK